MIPPIELTRKGFKALVDALRYADAIRFIKQFALGSGDYTKERQQWLEKMRLEDIWADIQQRQSQAEKENNEPKLG